MNFSKAILATSMATLLMMNSAAMAADLGTIDFTGELTTSPCTIKGTDLNKKVRLSNVPLKDVDSTGVAPTNFDISLENCDIGTLKTATMTIDGAADATNKQAFITKGTGSQGVGILISTGSKLITPGAAFDIPLTTGMNKIGFTASYVKLGSDPLVEGDVELSTAYTMTYK